MPRIRLIHWNQEQAIERAGILRSFGHIVDAEPLESSGSMKQLRDDPPDAIVIDLSRLPSHGRTMGMMLRTTKATQQVPLVFVDGETPKVQRVRDLMPDAMFTTWTSISRDLCAAIAHPPAKPIVPVSRSGGYSGTPLLKKLGVKDQTTLGLMAAPKDFERILGKLPAGVAIRRQPRSACDLLVCFVTSQKELKRRFEHAAALSKSGLWIAWPKKASGVHSDLTEDVIRAHGLTHARVDYKVCAIDATWSGLKFAWRAPQRGKSARPLAKSKRR